MIAALFNIPVDAKTLMRFSFHNRDAHELVSDAIFKKLGVTLPQYPIDPIKIEEFQTWLYSHQAMHNSVNSALSLGGNDLTDVDPTKPEQMSSWIENHAKEHVQWGNILGIG